MPILFLVHRMTRGFGVSSVAAALAQALAERGIPSVIGCKIHDSEFHGLDIRIVNPDPVSIGALAEAIGASRIVAHTSPYFEALPALAERWSCWAYEHGDPTPEMFVEDAAERARIAQHKREQVYPRIAGVIAISDFIRSDIQWPDARIAPNGFDDGPDLGRKPYDAFPPFGRKRLRVGALMRLGEGEARYKGRDELLALVKRFDNDPLIGFELMGRGAPSDADAYEAQGVRVHLNADESDKIRFLRGIDLLVSCSLWEGCNLPLLEAQSLATPAMAPDTGAHPETTPLVCSSLDEMEALIRRCAESPELLKHLSDQAYAFVRKIGRWSQTAETVAAILGVGWVPDRRPPPPPGRLEVARAYVEAARQSLRQDGLGRTLARIKFVLHRRFFGPRT